MCSSFTWGTVSVHYLLGLPLAYALRSATPNGLMLLVKLTPARYLYIKYLISSPKFILTLGSPPRRPH